VGVIVRRDDGCETAVKENNGDTWSSDSVVLWLGRRQDGDTIEWWREWPRLRYHFCNSGGVGVERFGEGSLWQWCGFNALVSAQEGR
jgi:hypothetical protein